MQKKFFMRRFKNYCLLLILPTVLVFLISFVVVNGQINRELDAQARNTLSNINTNLDFVVSSVVFQNDQLTNNSYMVLALKKLFKREPNIQYSDAIHLRNIKTMMQSIIQSYPYIQSVYLYLDGYDSFFSSQDGVMQFSEEEDRLFQMVRLFGMVFVINSIALLFLAYFTTKRTFGQLMYMIQVFHEAESGIYPTEPKKEMKDEYNVIMNNIIYLFLQTIRLNTSLVQKQHEQEVAQLTALQLQINPHFLFNTLQNVQIEIKKLNQEAGIRIKSKKHMGCVVEFVVPEQKKL